MESIIKDLVSSLLTIISEPLSVELSDDVLAQATGLWNESTGSRFLRTPHHLGLLVHLGPDRMTWRGRVGGSRPSSATVRSQGSSPALRDFVLSFLVTDFIRMRSACLCQSQTTLRNQVWGSEQRIKQGNKCHC